MAAMARFARACLPTPANVKGPAYRKGAPFRGDRLCDPGEPGETLLVAGRVTSAASCEPLPEALLDVWQTDARGRYSNLLGLARRGDPRGYRLRGRLRPRTDGEYVFTTVLPGHYPLWPITRPRHIHFLVTCPGHERLITQLYFAGDPWLARDPWADEALARALEPAPGHPADWRVRFDLTLDARPAP